MLSQFYESPSLEEKVKQKIEVIGAMKKVVNRPRKSLRGLLRPGLIHLVGLNSEQRPRQ